MTRKVQYTIKILEIVLFAIPVGAASYFSEMHQWGTFFIIVISCTILFIFLQIIQSNRVLSIIKQREERQFKLEIRFKEYGLADLYNIHNVSERYERNEATREIIHQGSRLSLLSLSAASYIDPGVKRHWDYLKPKLEDGVPFRLLLLNPFCVEKEVRDRLNSISTQYDSKFRLDLIIRLYNRYPNVSVRLTSYNIYCALFFSEADMIYDPYHLGRVEDRIENYFLAFRIKNQKVADIGHSYFSVLKRHYEFLWETGDDIESFMIEYREQIASTPFKDIPIRRRYALNRGGQ